MARKVIEEIRKQLEHPFLRERRLAIHRLAELLQDAESRQEAYQLLEEGAKNDPANALRELARSYLEEDAKSNPVFRISERRQYIFGAVCRQCHRVNYFDKRKVCSEKKLFYRTVEDENGLKLDELRLPCEFCGNSITVNVNCEGYS